MVDATVVAIRATGYRSAANGTVERQPLLVFLRSPDFDHAYAPAVFHLEQSGWDDVEVLDHTIAEASAVARLGEAAVAAYEHAARHGASFIVVGSPA